MKTNSALCASLVKKDLKTKFPNIIFSVKSENFAGGDSVTVTYNNAIPTDGIEAFLSKYEYGHFDSSNDIYEHSNCIDGLPQVKYLSIVRNISQDIRDETKIDIARQYGIVDIEDEMSWFKLCGAWSDAMVYRKTRDMTIA